MDQEQISTTTVHSYRGCNVDCFYRFEDLSESAQQTVLDANHQRNVDYDGWWESVYEQYDEKMKAIGFNVSGKYFSGFSSQGDGAVILGTISYFDFLKQTPEGIALLTVFKLRSLQDEELYDGAARFTHEGRYYHERSFTTGLETNADNWNAADCVEDLADNIHTFVEANINEWLTDICKEFYKALEAEYDYLTSDKCLREHYEHDDDLYDIDGEPV